MLLTEITSIVLHVAFAIFPILCTNVFQHLVFLQKINDFEIIVKEFYRITLDLLNLDRRFGPFLR